MALEDLRGRGVAVMCALLAGLVLSGCAALESPRVDGVVWQPDAATVQPRGTWDRLGAHELIVQWMVVDRTAFIDGAGFPVITPAPDWSRIGREPWASSVILGLAGRFDERAARHDLSDLVDTSRQLTALKPPLNVAGWYFPVEADPTWMDAPRMGALLADFPRPLWVSVYDKGNIGPTAFAKWLRSWVPSDVGVLFQDGVGEYVRSPQVASAYAQEISRRFGANRIAIIAEAFRPQQGGGFRPATAAELRGQLLAYRHSGVKVYLFDGPHYVPNATVEGLSTPER